MQSIYYLLPELEMTETLGEVLVLTLHHSFLINLKKSVHLVA